MIFLDGNARHAKRRRLTTWLHLIAGNRLVMWPIHQTSLRIYLTLIWLDWVCPFAATLLFFQKFEKWVDEWFKSKPEFFLVRHPEIVPKLGKCIASDGDHFEELNW